MKILLEHMSLQVKRTKNKVQTWILERGVLVTAEASGEEIHNHLSHLMCTLISYGDCIESMLLDNLNDSVLACSTDCSRVILSEQNQAGKSHSFDESFVWTLSARDPKQCLADIREEASLLLGAAWSLLCRRTFCVDVDGSVGHISASLLASKFDELDQLRYFHGGKNDEGYFEYDLFTSSIFLSFHFSLSFCPSLLSFSLFLHFYLYRFSLSRM